MFESYIPRILLCGDISSFQSKTDMAVEIVGQISFFGSPELGENYLFPKSEDVMAYVPKELHIFLNGTEISADELRKILDGTIDYIVFNDCEELCGRYNDLYSLKIFDRFIDCETLFNQARRNFYSAQNLKTLAQILRDKKVSHVLDVDGIFDETDFFMFPELFPIVDGVIENPSPIHENFYDNIYKSLSDCRFRTYDIIFIAERSPEEFIDVVIDTDDLTENILTFARKNSSLEKFFVDNENIFEKISCFDAINGKWYLIQKRMPKDFCVYVVTHKDIKLNALPKGYKIIHAGHAVAKEDFGYLGDDSGENISDLNRYVNEITALYWIWKNTSHSIIGLNHYRRFFVESEDKVFSVEKILSQESAEKILRDYDIIVAKNKLSRVSVSCWQKLVSGGHLEQFVANIFIKHIASKQPDYLSIFKHVSQAYTAFQYEIFITRRNIFNAYCEWIFSFLLDVTEEIFAKTNITHINNPRKYRIISFFSERLLTVWLWKNNLRIKRLPVLFRTGI